MMKLNKQNGDSINNVISTYRTWPILSPSRSESLRSSNAVVYSLFVLRANNVPATVPERTILRVHSPHNCWSRKRVHAEWKLDDMQVIWTEWKDYGLDGMSVHAMEWIGGIFLGQWIFDSLTYAMLIIKLFSYFSLTLTVHAVHHNTY